ncbi:hypothetical protein [Streptomyces sp. NPDC002889]|uniref:hypothetical protein n=1 Tax=Streptomyces sp. NPDC002889 TaxID=3364669 RepID=UPI00369026A8
MPLPTGEKTKARAEQGKGKLKEAIGCSSERCAQEGDGSLVMVAVPDHLDRLLATTGLDTLLITHPTIDAALAARPARSASAQALTQDLACLGHPVGHVPAGRQGRGPPPSTGSCAPATGRPILRNRPRSRTDGRC